MSWIDKLKFHHLKILVALAEQKNLTRVSELMNITQPALSKWLSGLEEEIGMPLFERHSKGIRPTPGGMLVVKHARRLVNDLERSSKDIELFKEGIQGTLMIGSSPVATDVVSKAVLALLKDYPNVHVRIIESVMTPLLEQLVSGHIDAVIGRVGGNALRLPLNYKVLYTEPICFVVRPGHPLAGQNNLDWVQLAGYYWIVWPTGTPIRSSIDHALVDLGMMMPANHVESGSMSATVRMLQGSDMVGILSQRLAESFANEQQLVILDLPKIAQKGSVGIFWRQNEPPSDALEAFLGHLEQASK
ncbi:LysR family transcriptional regulator [Advenella sp. RU8]|uniref:LysR family transcriptional regulator n=1 Tax=Advenella sp. RU8 TaxID=3399575 RepID=UPI003AAF1FD8